MARDPEDDANPLVQRWVIGMAGRTHVDLVDEGLEPFPRLAECLAPPNLSAVPDVGSAVWRDDDGLYVEFDGYLVDDGEDRVGMVHRRINVAHHFAQHVDFSMDAEWCGEGRGRRAMCSAAKLYIALGLHSVYLEAAEVGAYVWAQCGFDFREERSRDDLIAAAEDFLDVLEIDADLDEIEHPWDFARIQGTTTAREIAEARGDEPDEWKDLADEGNLDGPIELGKAILLASDHGGWPGVLDLSAQSPGLVQLARYAGCDEFGHG